MDYNRNLTEALGFVGVISSASQGTGTVTTQTVNMNILRRLVAVVNVGVVGASGTVDFQFQASPTSGGAFALITGAQIVQITSNAKVALLELKVESLGNLGVGPWVRGALIIGVAASQVSVELFGSASRYDPASDYNIATFQTPVVV